MLTVRADDDDPVLQLNAAGMRECHQQNYDRAESLLADAWAQAAALEESPVASALKATTLNNLGVLASNRGLPRDALGHIAAAHEIEDGAGAPSAATLVNLCAAANGCGEFDAAGAYADAAISMLQAAPRATPEEKALWGAAWHNLGVATLNTAQHDAAGTDDGAAVLERFRVATTATRRELGAAHPVTRGVHDTYRAVRDMLRERGAFRARLKHEPLPRLSAVARGRPTKSAHLQLPPRSALLAANQHNVIQRAFAGSLGSARAASLYTRRQPAPPPSGGRPQRFPLHHGSMATSAAQHSMSATAPSGSRSARMASTARTARGSASLPPIADAPHSARSAPGSRRSHGSVIAPATAHRAPQGGGENARPPPGRVEDMLLGDMWVELQVPAPPQGRPSGHRPSYAQGLHVLDPSAPVVEPVAHPAAYAPAPREERSPVRQVLAADPDAAELSGLAALIASQDPEPA